MADKVIRYGVVGLGRAGWNIHVAALRGRPDARIVAVADPEALRRKEAAEEFGCRTHESLESLLKQEDVEVVVLATPSLRHADESIAALKSGRHVVVEKPMAMNLAEAQRMVAAADAAGRKLFVNQSYRFSQELRYLLRIVNSGILGRLFHVRLYSGRFARRNDWQTLMKNGGGQLNNSGSHFIDMALQFMQAPVVEIMSDLQRIASAGDAEDNIKVFMRAANGQTADVETSLAQNVALPVPKWVLCGEYGTLASANGQSSTVRFFDPAKAPPLVLADGPAADRRYDNDDKLPWQEKVFRADSEPEMGVYDNVYDVLHREEAMLATPQSVCETVRVIEAARQKSTVHQVARG